MLPQIPLKLRAPRPAHDRSAVRVPTRDDQVDAAVDVPRARRRVGGVLEDDESFVERVEKRRRPVLLDRAERGAVGVGKDTAGWNEAYRCGREAELGVRKGRGERSARRDERTFRLETLDESVEYESLLAVLVRVRDEEIDVIRKNLSAAVSATRMSVGQERERASSLPAAENRIDRKSVV